MVYKLVFSNSFKKDYKLIKKQGKDISLLDKIIPILLSGKKLPRKYKDHQLKEIYQNLENYTFNQIGYLFTQKMIQS